MSNQTPTGTGPGGAIYENRPATYPARIQIAQSLFSENTAVWISTSQEHKKCFYIAGLASDNYEQWESNNLMVCYFQLKYFPEPVSNTNPLVGPEVYGSQREDTDNEWYKAGLWFPEAYFSFSSA